MRAARDQRVAVGGEQRGLALRVEAVLGHSRFRVGEKARAERVVRLQRVEAAVERIRGGGREPIVRVVHRGTCHSTTALPWCHEGS